MAYDIKEETAKEIRLRMERLAYEIDNAQNEYEECERELKRRGLKI